MEQIEGKIAAILDRTTVIINRGSLDGVSKGLTFYVYTELGPFNDPDTGEDLGTIVNVWGKVVVSNVADRLCMARTGYEYVPGIEASLLGGLFRGRRVQVKLPVDEGDISGWPVTLGVGTQVISQRPAPAAITAGEEVEALPAPSTSGSEKTDLPQGER
jgi:hypothetical protein